MRKSWLIGAGVVVAVAAGAGLWMTQRGPLPVGSAQAAKTPGAAASAPLDFRANEVVSPQLARLSQTIEFSGPLVAPNTAVLRAKASGTLLVLDVAEGARVRAGQLLGRIDMAELGSRIAERDANLESARATVLQAERSTPATSGWRRRTSSRPPRWTTRAPRWTPHALRCRRRRPPWPPRGWPSGTPAWSRRLPASSPSAMCCRVKRWRSSSRC